MRTDVKAPAVFRAPVLRRSWQFVGGMDLAAHQLALQGQADVLVADLEEFTAPADRPRARRHIHDLIANCKTHGKVAAVRINKLDEDGHEDLAGVMAAAPHAVLLPHSEKGAQIAELANAIDRFEQQYGHVPGSTEIVPTLESALALVNNTEIISASSRVSACLLAAEDLSADLGIERSATGTTLHAIRQRFLIECSAAKVVAIDCPFNFRDDQAFEADLLWARSVGFVAKCVVRAQQVGLVHQCFTPSSGRVAEATALVERFNRQHSATPEAEWVDGPVAAAAGRVLARAQLFEFYDRKAGRS